MFSECESLQDKANDSDMVMKEASENFRSEMLQLKAEHITEVTGSDLPTIHLQE